MNTITPLICSECGAGNYRWAPGFVYACTNLECDHIVSERDVELDEGESLAVVHRLLSVV